MEPAQFLFRTRSWVWQAEAGLCAIALAIKGFDAQRRRAAAPTPPRATQIRPTSEDTINCSKSNFQIFGLFWPKPREMRIILGIESDACGASRRCAPLFCAVSVHSCADILIMGRFQQMRWKLLRAWVVRTRFLWMLLDSRKRTYSKSRSWHATAPSIFTTCKLSANTAQDRGQFVYFQVRRQSRVPHHPCSLQTNWSRSNSGEISTQVMPGSR